MTTGLPGRAVRPGNPAGQPGSSVAGLTLTDSDMLYLLAIKLIRE